MTLPEAVCAAIVPGWRGHLPPEFFPRHIRLALLASARVFDFAAIARSGRPLRRLAPADREDLLERLSRSHHASLRGLVQWWKLVALVTAEQP